MEPGAIPKASRSCLGSRTRPRGIDRDFHWDDVTTALPVTCRLINKRSVLLGGRRVSAGSRLAPAAPARRASTGRARTATCRARTRGSLGPTVATEPRLESTESRLGAVGARRDAGCGLCRSPRARRAASSARRRRATRGRRSRTRPRLTHRYGLPTVTASMSPLSGLSAAGGWVSAVRCRAGDRDPPQPGAFAVLGAGGENPLRHRGSAVGRPICPGVRDRELPDEPRRCCPIRLIELV